MGEVLTPVEFDGIIGDVREALADVPEKFGEFVDEVVYWTEWMWDWVVEGIMDTLEWIGDTLSAVCEKLNEIFSFMGDPVALWNTGTSWVDNVGGPASGKQECFTLGYMKTDDEWQGTAADAYRNTFPPQKSALDTVMSISSSVDGLLTKVSIAIGVFWIGVAVALGQFLFELIGELAGAETGVGIGAAVAAAAVSCGKLSGIIAGAVGLIEGLLIKEIGPAMKDLHKLVVDGDSLPDGNWPKLTSDIADSSHKENKGVDSPWDMTKA